jgi:hypothetical protein
MEEASAIQEGDDFMIRFCCEHCGHKISVKDKHAGKRGKCPKCKSILTVPKPQVNGAGPGQSDLDESTISSKASAHDLTLLDVPRETKDQSQPAEQPVPDETAYEQLRRLQGGLVRQESDQILQRKLPWIIDIFLYPISKPGLIMLSFIIMVPLLFKFLGKTFTFAALGFPPMLIVATLVIMVGHLIRVLLSLYFYWYFCECIRESAAGQLRAPETIGSAPGLGEMLARLLRTLVCLIVFFGPVLIRFRYNRATDVVFWILFSYALFLFPVALLAVVMFDSLRGLHPFLLIGSIFSTFFQYCALVLFIAAGVFILLSLPVTKEALILRFILRCICIYLALVAAHLLGRFYWRYQEKLNWEV